MADLTFRRVAIEATAIVLSILLAFAIDAWWEQRGLDADAAVLISGLRADFEASS